MGRFKRGLLLDFRFLLVKVVIKENLPLRDNWFGNNEADNTVDGINIGLLLGVKVDFQVFRTKIDEPETGVRRGVIFDIRVFEELKNLS